MFTSQFILAQLVEHRISIAEVTGLNNIEGLIFSKLLLFRKEGCGYSSWYSTIILIIIHSKYFSVSDWLSIPS